MNELRIRRMADADLDAIIAIAANLNTAPHWPRSAYEFALNPSAVPHRLALVAEASGSVVGFTIASFTPPQAELETIAVSKTFQRRRAGSALLSSLLATLESSQITEITLEVRASNFAAQAFYSAHSFVAFARRKAYYADTGEDAVIMRVVLPIPQK